MPYITGIERRATQRGLEQGRQEGHQEGHQEGLLEEAREAILDNLEIRFGDLPKDLVETISQLLAK